MPATAPATLVFPASGSAVTNVAFDDLGMGADDLSHGESRTAAIAAPPGVRVFHSQARSRREAGRTGIVRVVGSDTPVPGGPSLSTAVAATPDS